MRLENFNAARLYRAASIKFSVFEGKPKAPPVTRRKDRKLFLERRRFAGLAKHLVNLVEM